MRSNQASPGPKADRHSFWHRHAAIADAETYCDGLTAWAQAIGIAPITVGLVPESRDGFGAVLDWWQTEQATSVVAGRTNRPIVQQVLPERSWTAADHMLVGCLLRGSMTLRTDDDRVACIGPGDVFVTDYARPLQLRWNPHQVVYVVLPAPLAALDWPLGRRGTCERLAKGGAARLLADLLRAFVAEKDSLDAAATAQALRAAEALAISCAQALPSGADQRAARGLLDAAQQHIERHHHVPGLSAAAIAQALGCSRSQLYRAFAVAGTSVFAAIGAARMRHARALMSEPETGTDLAAVALACGYGDLSAFGKAFRRAAGMTPGTWRRLGRRDQSDGDVWTNGRPGPPASVRGDGHRAPPERQT